MVSKSKKQKLKASPHLAAKLGSLDASSPSPLLAAAFSPQHLRTGLFASAIRGLDGQRLRIHDVTTSRLVCEHVFEKNIEIHSLAWGTLTDSDKKKRKRRKRRRESKTNGNVNGRDYDEDEDEDGGDDADEGDVLGTVVALATNAGKVFIYSPSQGSIVKTLEGEHRGNVFDFQFVEASKKARGWSCGDDSLVEWDLKRGIKIRSITLPKNYGTPRRILPTSTSVLCASHSTYNVDLENPLESRSPVSSHTSQIHSLLMSKSKSAFLSAARGDRFVNVADIGLGKLVGSLVAQSDVESVAIDPTEAALVLVNSEGKAEIFEKPWSYVSQVAQEDTTRKKPLTRTSAARIAVARPSSESVKILSAGFMKEEVVLAWVENGTNVYFATVKWTGATSDVVGIQGDIQISQAKSLGIGARDTSGTTMNGVKEVGKSNLDQAAAVVVDGLDTEDVGMTDAAGLLAEEEANQEGDGLAMDDVAIARADGSGDEEEDDEEDKEEFQEPSFAEKFQQLEGRTGTESSMDQSNSIVSSNSGTAITNITVPSLGDTTKALRATNQSQFPNATSLTTVLTQALKTSDRALLETCFHTTNPSIITSTISRLDSVLAVTLISKLSELISRKPGRAGSLMIWVETTFVYHGGHLLTLPDLISRLASLQRVLGRRSASLNKMLALRGRLRMLVAQMKLRSMSRAANPGDDDDEAVVYVEGVNDDDESSDENEVALLKGAEDDDVEGSDSASDEEDEEVHGVNGVLDSAEEDEEGSDAERDHDVQLSDEGDDEDDVGRYLDDEAEESSDGDDEESENESFVVSDDEVEYDEDNDDGFLDDGDEEDEQPKKSKSFSSKSKGKLSKSK